MDIYFELKRTVRHTAVYALGNIAPKLAGLILVPLYARYLAVSQYGILGMFDLILQILTLLVGLGLVSAFIRWYSIASSEVEKKKTMYTTTIATIGIGAVLFFVVLIVSDPLAKILFGSNSSHEPHQQFVNYIQLVMLTAIFDRLLLISLSLLRIQERAFRYSIISILRFTLLVLLNSIFVAVYQLGIGGILLGIFLSTALSFGLTTPLLRRNMQPGFLSDHLKDMLRYGIPIMAGSLATIILRLGDRYLLKLLSSLESVGLYTLGYQIASIISLLFVNSFALGFYPAIFKLTGGEKAKLFLSRTLTYYTLFVFWTILVLSLYAPEILRLFISNPSYWKADTVVFFLSFGFGFHGMFFILSSGFYLEKRTLYITALILGAVLLNIGLNLLLIPRWDIIGAAIASVLSYAPMVAATAFFAKRIYPVEYNWARIISVLILTAGLYGLSHLWRDSALWTNIALDFIVCACYPLILYILRFFSAEELRRARGWLSRIFSHSTHEKP